MNNSTTKRCNKCGHEYPATIEFFRARDKAHKRLRNECRECIRLKNQAYHAANKEKHNEQSRAYHKKNREKLLLKHRDYRHRNKEQVVRLTRDWRRANKDYVNTTNRQWWKDHPETAHAINVKRNAKRRAARVSAEGTHTIADMRRQYDSQKGKCWWCGEPVAWSEREDDHLIPLNRGGTDNADNIVVSCRRCNRSKGSKLPHEWNGRLF